MKNRTRWMLGIALLAGCTEASAPAEGEADQALSEDFTDASGTVTIRVRQCAASAYLHAPTASCGVDSDFVLVGGGAEVIGEENPGALLTASYPDLGLTSWTASSKDDRISYLNSVRPYSIGLRLAGVSASTLRSNMRVVMAHSAPAEHPAVSAALPAGFVLIGGGAKANWSGEGQMLTSTYPIDSTHWFAASKDHLAAEVGTVDSYAIGITTGTIPGFGSSLDVMTNVAYFYQSSGYGTAAIAEPGGWVGSSIGGDARYTSWGRMLTDLIPFVDGASVEGALVRSKDQVAYDGGYTFAYLLSVRRH